MESLETGCHPGSTNIKGLVHSRFPGNGPQDGFQGHGDPGPAVHGSFC